MFNTVHGLVQMNEYLNESVVKHALSFSSSFISPNLNWPPLRDTPCRHIYSTCKTVTKEFIPKIKLSSNMYEYGQLDYPANCKT